MLKRKFKIIALLFVMISTLTLSTVRAENETENASAISEDSATVTSNEQDLETTSSSGETSALLMETFSFLLIVLLLIHKLVEMHLF